MLDLPDRKQIPRHHTPARRVSFVKVPLTEDEAEALREISRRTGVSAHKMLRGAFFGMILRDDSATIAVRFGDSDGAARAVIHGLDKLPDCPNLPRRKDERGLW